MSARERLWQTFFQLTATDPLLAQTPTRYGGRLSFAWLIPDVAPEHAEHEPHVLLYLTAPAGQPARVGIAVEGNKRAPDNVAERCTTLWAELEGPTREALPEADLSASGLTLEVPIDQDEALAAAISRLLPVVRKTVVGLRDAFST